MSASFRDTFQDRAEGLCLVCLGVFLAALASSRFYWYFLNPKFSPLSLGAGTLLAVCGLALLLRPESGRGTPARMLRQAVVLGFLCLAAFAVEQIAREPLPGVLNPASAEDSARTPETEAPVPLRVTKNGVQYLRLNLAELYIMLDKGRTDYPAHFALRVQVGGAPGLEQRGLALVKRTAVVCCLADSLELAFLVTGLGSAQPGDWLEVFGHLEPLTDKAALKALPNGGGPSIRVVNPNFRIQAEAVDPTPAPDFPYLFEFREQEPFAW